MMNSISLITFCILLAGTLVWMSYVIRIQNLKIALMCTWGITGAIYLIANWMYFNRIQ